MLNRRAIGPGVLALPPPSHHDREVMCSTFIRSLSLSLSPSLLTPSRTNGRPRIRSTSDRSSAYRSRQDPHQSAQKEMRTTLPRYSLSVNGRSSTSAPAISGAALPGQRLRISSSSARASSASLVRAFLVRRSSAPDSLPNSPAARSSTNSACFIRALGSRLWNRAKRSLPAPSSTNIVSHHLADRGSSRISRTRSDECLKYRPSARQASPLVYWSGAFSMTARRSFSTDGETELARLRASRPTYRLSAWSASRSMARENSGPSNPRWTIQNSASMAAGSLGADSASWRKRPRYDRGWGYFSAATRFRSSSVLAFLRAS